MAGGGDIVAFGARLVDGRQIEGRLRDVQTGVDNVIGADDARKAWPEWKPERLEVRLAPHFRQRRVDVRQELAEGDTTRTSGLLDLGLGFDRSEVVIEGAA